jgi:hypothetical protein
MIKNNLTTLEKEALIELLVMTQSTIQKKNYLLKKTRAKLSFAKKRIVKMKSIISDQRQSILKRNE